MILGVGLTSAVVGAPGIVSAILFGIFLFLDIYCVFIEIGSVVYDTLNYERTDLFVQNYLSSTLSSLLSASKPAISASLSPFSIADKERLILYDPVISSVMLNIDNKNSKKKEAEKYKSFRSFDFKNDFFNVRLYYKKVKKNIFSLLYYTVMRSINGNIFLYPYKNHYIIMTPSVFFNKNSVSKPSLEFNIDQFRAEEEEDITITGTDSSASQKNEKPITFSASLENISILKSIVILRHFLFNIENNLFLFDSTDTNSAETLKLKKLMYNSIKFEKKEFPKIYSLLKENGWNVDNFLYGAFNNN